MKTKIFISLLYFISLFFLKSSFSQNPNKVNPDPRLYECFDSAYVQRTLDRNPETIIYYNFYLDNSYFIGVNDTEKPTTTALDIFKVKQATNHKGPKSNFKILFDEDLNKFDIKKFNVLKYDFLIDFNNYVTYKLGDTGKLLIFYPKSVFLQKYNEYKKSLGY